MTPFNSHMRSARSFGASVLIFAELCLLGAGVTRSALATTYTFTDLVGLYGPSLGATLFI